MQDQSLYSKSQPHSISEGLQNFIDAMVEEIVFEGRPFDTQKKWLRKYAENEGVDYETLEKNLLLLFETFDEIKRRGYLFSDLITQKIENCFISNEMHSTILRFVSKCKKLGIFVISGSCSMSEQTIEHISKAEAASLAMNDFFSIVRTINYGNNSSFAVINYDHRSMVRMQITEAKNLDDHGDYNPMKGLGGGAYISVGLKEAKRIAEDFLSNSQVVNKPVMVFIISDGIDMNPCETIALANSLKQMPQVRIVSCYMETIGTDAGLSQERADFLRNLSSEERLLADHYSDLFRYFDMDYLWDPMID